MPDVFISYAKGDKKRVAIIAAGLEAEGMSVWWDPDNAEQAAVDLPILSAHCTIVCWSKASAKTARVPSDATFAHEERKLVPVTLQACEPPEPFNMMLSADLTQWTGDPDDEDWIACLEEIRAVVETGRRLAPAPTPRFTPPPPAPPPPLPPPPRFLAPPPQQRIVAPEPPPPDRSASRRAKSNLASEAKAEKQRQQKPREDRDEPNQGPGQGIGRFLSGMVATGLVLTAVVFAAPYAANYVRGQLEKPPAQVASASNTITPDSAPPVATAPVAPLTTAAPLSTAPAPAAPVAPPPAAVKPVIASARPAPSVVPRPQTPSTTAAVAPSIVRPPANATPARPTLADMETCMAAIATACSASSSEFAVNGRLSRAEITLMGTALFPDGQDVTERNLRSCQLGSTRSVMNSATGRRACAAIAPLRPAEPEIPIATVPLATPQGRLPPVRPGTAAQPAPSAQPQSVRPNR